MRLFSHFGLGSRIRSLVTSLLDSHELVAIDVGARGDIPIQWRSLDGVASVFSFDPDAAECEKLQAVYDSRGHGHKYTVVPIALGARNGERTLYVTSSPSGASLFPVDVPIVRAYVDKDYLDPIKEQTVLIRNAREAFDEVGCQAAHLMKLDVQGAELEVLSGLGDHLLQTCLGLQLEAAFQFTGREHPRYCEIDTFVRNAGLDLYDLSPVRVHRTLRGKRSNFIVNELGVHNTSPSVAGRIWEADALYLRNAESVIAWGDEGNIRRLVVCFCVYSLFTEALHTARLARVEGLVSPGEYERIRNLVLRWHRISEYHWWHGRNRLAHLLRAAFRKFGSRGSVQGALKG